MTVDKKFEEKQDIYGIKKSKKSQPEIASVWK
jgi:hypothetical protein